MTMEYQRNHKNYNENSINNERKELLLSVEPSK